tara:strand:+ start:26 stop:382 length:357 start_codon:yes stop_codon:yes gene_type:complete
MHVLKDDQLLHLLKDIKIDVLDGYVGAGFDTDEMVRLAIARHIAVLIKQTQIEAFAKAVNGRVACEVDGHISIETNFYSPTLAKELHGDDAIVEDVAHADYLDGEDEDIEVEEADTGG